MTSFCYNCTCIYQVTQLLCSQISIANRSFQLAMSICLVSTNQQLTLESNSSVCSSALEYFYVVIAVATLCLFYAVVITIVFAKYRHERTWYPSNKEQQTFPMTVASRNIVTGPSDPAGAYEQEVTPSTSVKTLHTTLSSDDLLVADPPIRRNLAYSVCKGSVKVDLPSVRSLAYTVVKHKPTKTYSLRRIVSD